MFFLYILITLYLCLSNYRNVLSLYIVCMFAEERFHNFFFTINHSNVYLKALFFLIFYVYKGVGRMILSLL